MWELEQVVSAIFDDCDGFEDRYVFPDMTTRVPLVMYLSQEEWTTLYSAVLTGADLSYPNTSHDVENLFLQTVNCTMSQLCQALADCLLNSQAVFDALNQILAENGLTGGVGDPFAPLSEEITGQNLLPAGYICTDDKAFGMALAVVDSINSATTEVLQAIEILTNPVEIANELGDNVPGIGALTSAGDIAAWIQNSAQEAYELAWSPTVRDELACLLWCDFKQGCSLTFDSIWNTYLSKSGATPPAGVLLTDWLAWLIGLPFVGATSTVATISLLGLLAMRYGGSFGDFQLGIRSIETVIALSADDSSSDWSIVCDPCATTWCYRWLDGETTDLVGFNYYGCTPLVTASQVAGCTTLPTTLQQAGAWIEPASTFTVTKITWEINVHKTRAVNQAAAEVAGYGSVYSVTAPEGVSVHEVSGLWENITHLAVFANAGSNIPGTSPDAQGAFAYLNWIQIEGTGTNPFGSDNCP